jgi:hypothetical protein
MALPDEMARRWIIEGLTLGIIIFLLYLNIRYFVAEHVYRLTASELTLTRERLGFLRSFSITIDLREASVLAKKGAAVLKGHPHPIDNFCASLGGRLKTGSVLVYNDPESGRPKRLMFEPSPKLFNLISEQLEK